MVGGKALPSSREPSDRAVMEGSERTLGVTVRLSGLGFERRKKFWNRLNAPEAMDMAAAVRDPARAQTSL